jgi:hypothetical protein
MNRYDKLYREADKLMFKFNPCAVKNGTCMKGRAKIRFDRGSFCCGGCKYLARKGCRVKALLCRLWTCSYLDTVVPVEFKLRQDDLFNQAYKHKLLWMRESRQNSLKFAKELTWEDQSRSVRSAANLSVRRDCYQITCGSIRG